MTDETTHEVLHRGTAVLATDADADEPTLVNGVAIGEDDVTTGMSGKRTIWPAETLREAADKLVGKPIVRNHPDPESPQPPIEEVIGEVTNARYEDGIGLLWQGELDDPDIATQVERGRADVSPVMARDLGEFDEDKDAHVATEIHDFRDLGVVSQGAAASNSIQSGEAAMSTAALAEAFAEADSDADTPDDDPQDGASTRTSDNGDTQMTEDDLSDKEREILAQARQLDGPTVVETAAAEKLDEAGELLAAAEGISNPTVVDEATHETQADRVETVEAMMDSVLIEETGLKEATVEAMSFDAKAAEFEDDEGNIDTEALVQNPQTGDGGGDDGLGEEQESLSEDDEERLEQLESEISFWSGRDSMQSYVEGLRDEREALSGGD